MTESIAHALRHTPLTREDVEAFAAIAQRLVDKGLKPKRVFPKGLPLPDGVYLECEAAAELVPDLIAEMTVEERLEEIRLQSIGVPVNDGLLVRFGIR